MIFFSLIRACVCGWGSSLMPLKIYCCQQTFLYRHYHLSNNFWTFKQAPRHSHCKSTNEEKCIHAQLSTDQSLSVAHTQRQTVWMLCVRVCIFNYNCEQERTILNRETPICVVMRVSKRAVRCEGWNRNDENANHVDQQRRRAQHGISGIHYHAT